MEPEFYIANDYINHRYKYKVKFLKSWLSNKWSSTRDFQSHKTTIWPFVDLILLYHETFFALN